MISFLIIVPTLDSYDLLPALVASLKAQTFPHWRVHFVDGPSGERHREYLELLCKQDLRFSYSYQDSNELGIFGAMNQGIRFAEAEKDWILFWGSDDKAASPSVLETIAKKLRDYNEVNDSPDLLICEGIYYHLNANIIRPNQQLLGRESKFFLRHSFRRSLFWGSTPPHQATFFGPGAISYLARFSSLFSLSADLDYFLRISTFPKIKVRVERIQVVWMGDAGISNQQTKQRLKEVRMAYKMAFRNQWWIPFFLRYIQRIQSIVKL
ncbi:MAG: glycosyltransferase [Cyanobacteriota bacterium]|jgi:glycosyltransferase involved in cell wall biosynthesis